MMLFTGRIRAVVGCVVVREDGFTGERMGSSSVQGLSSSAKEVALSKDALSYQYS